MADTSLTRQHYNEAFLRALERLNPEQREAVEHIEGPVLVIAGPGTGKTHILTARIGRILMETDTLPANILCLTFTDAGVRAMRERLLAFIGPEAHRVHIYTFHSFCNSIIQDNLEWFGRHDLEPLTDLERIEIVRQLIDGLDVDHPLKRGRTDAYFYEEHLYDLFQRMKAEDWTVGYVHECIDTYLADLPNRPEFVYQRRSGPFAAGDLKEARLAEERTRMERLRAAVALFPRYEQAMRQARRYDYDDMILWVLRAFEENQALLRSYQERYLYVLVDEYQDTNGAQNEVLRRLIDFWENPNVFIVGDDDQSIFEFQGARLKNLTDFYRDYRRDLRLVLLRENYRSSQHILDAAGALIRHNERRIVNNLRELGVDKLLVARHETFAGSGLRPHLIAYPNRLQEETDIVGRIAALREAGVPLEEVAILYARHRQARNIVRLLEKRGIPYSTRRRVNILHLPLVENLREMLEYLDLESRQAHSGEPLLFRILHFRYLDVPPADTARLGAWLGRADAGSRLTWRAALRDEALPARLGLTEPAALSRFAGLIDDLLHEQHQLTLPALVERLLNRSGLLAYVLAHPDRPWLLQVIKTFFDFVVREAERRPRLDLREFMELLRRMEANRLPLALNREIHAEHGVNLVTAHSAKGLEFRYVFLIDCTQDYWEPRGRGSRYRFPLPDTLTFSGEEDALEARRRLFYVAMTRAKEHLYLTYSRADAEGKELRRTAFLDEIADSMGFDETFREVPPAEVAEAQMLHLLEHAPPVLPAPDAATLDDLLGDFALSISALNSYLRCPLAFFYEHVLRVPVRQSEAASYGLAAHNALQRLFERMLRHADRQFPALPEFIRLFEYEMERQRGLFSTREYTRRLEMGRRHLSDYYRLRHEAWPREVRLEHHIRNLEVDGVPVTGMIDRIDLTDARRARVVDYKTGRPDAARLRPPTDALPYGGSYWRQLVFYKILFEHAENGAREVDAGVISYLDPDPNGTLPEKEISFHPEDTALVRHLIRDTYARIRRHEFTTGCGQPSCPWCAFVRHNVAVDSFADEEQEGLDD